MTKGQFWSQLTGFILALMLILIVREYLSHKLIANDIESYQTHMMLNIVSNILIIIPSYLLILRNGLGKVAGIKDTKLKYWYLLLFPLYLVLLNLTSMDEVNTSLLFPNILFLIMYCLSIGLAEELSIRGFIQSSLISRFGHNKKNVILAVLVSSLLFGLLHLINFDKGLYGEISSVFYATFIGVMFGSLLVITRKLYPLIIIHALIDFVAKFDKIGIPIKEKVSEVMSMEGSIIITLLILPCLLYGLGIMKKYDLVEKV